MDYSSTQSFFNLRRHRPSFPLGLPGFPSSEAGYLSSLPAQGSLEPFGGEEEEPASAFLPSNSSSGPRRGSSGSDRVFFDTSMDSNLGDNLAAVGDRSARIDDSWYSRGKADVWDDGEGSERTAGPCHSEADCYGNTVNGFYPASCGSEEGLRQRVKTNYSNHSQAVYNGDADSGCVSKQTGFHCRDVGTFAESGAEYSRMDSRLTDDYSGREEDYGSSCGSGEDQVQAVEVEGPWHSVSPSSQGEGRWRGALEDHHHHSLTTESPPQRAQIGRMYTQKLDSFSEAFLSQKRRIIPLAPGGDPSEQMWEFGAMRGETTEPVKSRQSCAFGSDPYLPPSSSSSSLTSFPSPPTSSHLMSSVLSPPPTPLPPPSHSPSKMDSPGCGAGHAAPLQAGEPLGALQFFMSRLQSVPSAHPSGMMWKFPPVSHCFPQPGGRTGNPEETPRSSNSEHASNSTATPDIPQSPQAVFFTSSSHRPSSLHPTRALNRLLPSRPPRPSGQRQQAEDYTQKVRSDLTSQKQSLPQKHAAPLFTGRPFPSVLHSSRGQKRGRYTPQPVLNPHRKGTGLFSSLSSLHHRDAAAACGEEEEESPCINVGPDHQADLPSCREDGNWSQGQEPLRERLLWKPWDQLDESVNLQDQVAKLLSMCSSSCLPGGGSNTELALHCLHQCQGNTMATLEMLLFSQPSPAGDYHYSGCNFWTDDERNLFTAALATHGKDFSLIQKMVKTKSVHQCVEFYYLNKKLQDKQKKQKEEESRDEELERQRSATPKCQPVDRQFVREEVVPVPPLASFFPCKLCGKMFFKIKSRNAHMKIHRQPQEDWTDRRLQHQLLTQRLALSRPTHLMPIPGADLLPPQASALPFPSPGLLEAPNGNPGDVSGAAMNGNLVLPCNTNVLSPSSALSYGSIAFPNSHPVTNIDGVNSSQRESISVSPFHPSWSSYGHQTDMAPLYTNTEVKEEVLAETAVEKGLISWQ